jgi:hypothetical protein
VQSHVPNQVVESRSGQGQRKRGRLMTVKRSVEDGEEKSFKNYHCGRRKRSDKEM